MFSHNDMSWKQFANHTEINWAHLDFALKSEQENVDLPRHISFTVYFIVFFFFTCSASPPHAQCSEFNCGQDFYVTIAWWDCVTEHPPPLPSWPQLCPAAAGPLLVQQASWLGFPWHPSLCWFCLSASHITNHQSLGSFLSPAGRFTNSPQLSFSTT